MTTAVLLDVVGSRAHDDQVALFRTVAAAVEDALVVRGGATSAGPTVGDEFQALHDDLRIAVRDVARLRVSLRGEHGIDIRAGLGVGEVVSAAEGDATAPAQSGSAWWHARSALEAAGTTPRGWPARGWWLEADDGTVDLPAMRALLIALDTIIERFDDDDRAHAIDLLDGATQADLVASAGVSQSTMSARLHRHGVYGWVRAVQSLTGEPGS